MLSFQEILDATALRLGTERPEPGPDGDHVFELAEGMRLALRALAAGAGMVAWAEAAPAGEGGADAEARAAEFLRLRLARLRRVGGVSATRDEGGGLVLYSLLRPETEREWFAGVETLLNETEVMRRLLTAGGAFGAAASPDLFSGQFGQLLRP